MLPKTEVLIIAIIDDDPFYRKLLNFLLNKANFIILFEAENGADGIRLIREAAMLPDLVILDLEMPVMDGFETIKLLKVSWPQIKIIAHSSVLDPNAQHRMIASGADYFLIKGKQSMAIAEKIWQVFKGT